jgi:hypothetical protein
VVGRLLYSCAKRNNGVRRNKGTAQIRAETPDNDCKYLFLYTYYVDIIQWVIEFAVICERVISIGYQPQIILAYKIT